MFDWLQAHWAEIVLGLVLLFALSSAADKMAACYSLIIEELSRIRSAVDNLRVEPIEVSEDDRLDDIIKILGEIAHTLERIEDLLEREAEDA